MAETLLHDGWQNWECPFERGDSSLMDGVEEISPYIVDKVERFQTPIRETVDRLRCNLTDADKEKILRELFPFPKAMSEFKYASSHSLKSYRLSVTHVPEQIYTAGSYYHTTSLSSALSLLRDNGEGELVGAEYLNMATELGLQDCARYSSREETEISISHRKLALFFFYRLLEGFDIDTECSEFFVWAGSTIDSEQIIAERHTAQRGLTSIADFAANINGLISALDANLNEGHNSAKGRILADCIARSANHITYLRGNWLEELRKRVEEVGYTEGVDRLRDVLSILDTPQFYTEKTLSRGNTSLLPKQKDLIPVVLVIDTDSLFAEPDLGGLYPVVLSPRPPSTLLPIARLKPPHIKALQVVDFSGWDAYNLAVDMLEKVGFPRYKINRYSLSFPPNSLLEPREVDNYCMARYGKGSQEPNRPWTRDEHQEKVREAWWEHIKQGQVTPCFDTFFGRGLNHWREAGEDLLGLVGPGPFVPNGANELDRGDFYVRHALAGKNKELITIPGVFGDAYAYFYRQFCSYLE